MSVRVCPDRDAECPWGMGCPYVLGRYECKPGNHRPPADMVTRAANLTGAQPQFPTGKVWAGRVVWDGTTDRQPEPREDQETDWKSRTQKAEAALAEAVGILRALGDEYDRDECCDDIAINRLIERGQTFLSLLGEAGGEEVRGSSVARAEVAASSGVKSDSPEGL